MSISGQFIPIIRILYLHSGGVGTYTGLTCQIDVNIQLMFDWWDSLTLTRAYCLAIYMYS